MTRPAKIVIGALGLCVAAAIAWQWVSLHRIPAPPPITSAAARTEAETGPVMIITPEWIGPPGSVQAIVDDVDAILVARRDSSPPETVIRAASLPPARGPGPSPSPPPITRHRFTALDVVKGDIRAGSTLPVTWMGRPIDVVAGFPAPRPGDVYLFFLNAGSNGYYPAYGPYASLRVIDGKAVRAGKLLAPALVNNEGRLAVDLMSTLRRLTRAAK